MLNEHDPCCGAKNKSPITWPVHDHLIYFTCSLHLKTSQVYVCISNFIPSINCRTNVLIFSGLVPFACFLLERDTRKGLTHPPCSAPCHCVSLTPSPCLPASICKWSRLSAYVTCSLRTHSSTVGRLAAHSPRPLHLIVPTLTWENREWCFPHSCRCRARRINNSVGMAELWYGRSGSPLTLSLCFWGTVLPYYRRQVKIH